MNLSRRIFFAAGAGWLNRFIAIGLGLVFTRVLFAKLVREEQGLWLLVGNSTAFLAMLDLGLLPTLTRRIALACGRNKGGAAAELDEGSRREIADLFTSGLHLYRVLAAVVFVLGTGAGLLLLSRLHFEQVSPHRAYLAWIILSAGYALNVWAQPWGCLVNGMGLVGWNTVLAMVLNTLTVAVQLAVVYCGGGIIAMASVAAVGAVVNRQATFTLLRWMHPQIFGLRGRWDGAAVRSMMSPALRAWITMLGGFLILQTDQYFISYFMTTKALPEYQAAYQIVMNMYAFAVLFATSSSVYISHLWQAGDLERVHGLVRRSLRLGLFLMACGVAWLVVAGRPIFDLWLGAGHFVGYPVLLTFCAMASLEAHHVIISSCSRATEDEAFAAWAIGAGILNLIFTWLLIRPLGLWGVALGTMLAQLLTNNWYASYRGLRRLRMSLWRHVETVLIPVALVFGAALAAGWLLAIAARPADIPYLEVFASLGASGCVGLSSIWLYGIEEQDRERAYGYIRRRVAVLTGHL